jgi:enoyl-[acyl-carrier-protein] reductase (NADH)
VGDHQELANLAAYLVSDFSAYVNGEVVVIDGGEWLKALDIQPLKLYLKNCGTN